MFKVFTTYSNINGELKQGTFLKARAKTGSENFACQVISLSQTFKLIVFNGEEILNNIIGSVKTS